ncbi:hypothetical protein QUB63_34005 [Microcoleus sp. ARI1-B5]
MQPSTAVDSMQQRGKLMRLTAPWKQPENCRSPASKQLVKTQDSGIK